MVIENTNYTENASEMANLRESLKKMMDKNPQGGEIRLDEFCKANPKASRNDCVKLLKKTNAGVFITGRRGGKSRFVYGEAATKFLDKKPAKPQTSRRSEPSTPEGSAHFELRVGVGDKITTIPITLELAVA